MEERFRFCHLHLEPTHVHSHRVGGVPLENVVNGEDGRLSPCCIGQCFPLRARIAQGRRILSGARNTKLVLDFSTASVLSRYEKNIYN